MLDLVTGGPGSLAATWSIGFWPRVAAFVYSTISSWADGQTSISTLEILRLKLSNAIFRQAGRNGRLCRVARVFHLAARADVSVDSGTGGYFRANVDGTFAVSKAPARKPLNASSTSRLRPAMHPGGLSDPETTAADPRYPYALTKYLGEQLVMHWADIYKLPCASVRFFNVYGPGPHQRHLRRGFRGVSRPIAFQQAVDGRRRWRTDPRLHLC